MTTFTGKVVAITGGSGGLGTEMARQITAKGGRVALLDLRGVHELAATLTGARGWEVDVTDAAGLTRVAQEVTEHFGRVDVVVANAGLGSGGTLLDQDPAAYDQIVEVNLLGSIRTVRAFLPAVVESKGYVLQIASLAALVHPPLMSAYCASKAGVEAFAHCLRGEVAYRGVDVGVAYLAFTDTPMVRNVDRVPALAALRSGMPGPFGRTYPVVPAVTRLVEGIERRSAHVYAQRWLRGIPPLRALLPAVITASQGSRVAKVESALAADRV